MIRILESNTSVAVGIELASVNEIVCAADYCTKF